MWKQASTLSWAHAGKNINIIKRYKELILGNCEKVTLVIELETFGGILFESALLCYNGEPS